MPSNYFTFCHPLVLLPSVFSSIRVFSSESTLHIKWLKYWSFGFSISPSNEYSGLISFRIDWFDLLVVQVTAKSLLQCHRSEASILVLSLLHVPALTSIHDYWKNHSFDYMDVSLLCISLLCLILLLRFYLIASFRTYSLVTSFCRILILGNWVTFLDLGEVVLCRRCPGVCLLLSIRRCFRGVPLWTMCTFLLL